MKNCELFVSGPLFAMQNSLARRAVSVNVGVSGGGGETKSLIPGVVPSNYLVFLQLCPT